MRVFLTGGNGMVGTNVREHPSAKRHDIVAPPRRQLDLRSYRDVHHALEEIRPDIVIHAAGKVGGIHANICEPVDFLLDNLDMGRNVIEAAREAGITRLINLGSSCMYPRNARNPLTEDMILTGEFEPTNEGYALAKVMVARLCDYIHRESPRLRYKTLVPCNIYGRYDDFDPLRSHMVPAIVHKLHQAKTLDLTTVDIWGDGQARREFMYASDLATCIWRAVEQYDTLPPLMNVGLGHDWTVNEYYATASEIIGYTGTFVHDLTKPVGMAQKLVHPGKALTWGWHAATSLKDGLAATYAYYLDTIR